MQHRLRAGTSLYARLSLVFGLLVAVPLAVSGLVLTLVARNSVLNSGDVMSQIGRDAVMRTRDRLVTAVGRNLDEVTEQVSDAAQRSLKNTSNNHIKTSERAVSEATDQIIRNGRGVFYQAGQDSAGGGYDRVREAAADLRDLARESLEHLERE